MDCEVQGRECLCQGGLLGEPGGGAMRGDEGHRHGHCEGVGAPGGWGGPGGSR